MKVKFAISLFILSIFFFLMAFALDQCPLSWGATTSSVSMPLVSPDSGPDQLVQIFQYLPNIWKGHDKMLAAGLILAGIVIAIRMWEKARKIPDEWVMASTFGLTFLGTLATGLQLHKPLSSILTVSLTTGAVAIGGWSALEDMCLKVVAWGVGKLRGKNASA